MTEAEVGEQVDEVDAPNRRPVDQVLTFAAALQAPGDRKLAVVERTVAGRIVEHQLDLAGVDRRALGTAGEEYVVGLLGPQLARSQRAGRPDDGVGDVRLARAVRTDDDGNARLEPYVDGVGEGLEALDLDRLQVQSAPPAAALRAQEGRAKLPRRIAASACMRSPV
jgi:hypothetical protein